MFENKKIFILGMAKSGFEAAKLLATRNNKILITDQKEQKEEHVSELKRLGVEYIVTEHPEEILDQSYDVLIKNPGIRKDHVCVEKARKLKIPVINEVEMAAKLLPKNVHIIAVTGSNGKTTTVTITYEILAAMGFPVYLVGNIGTPLSSIVNQIKENDMIVIEVSDHQLCDMYEFHPNIAVLTNLSEVHLDFHGDYKTYKNVKKKLFQNMTTHDIAILNHDNYDVMELTSDLQCKKLYFSGTQQKDCYVMNGYIWYQDEKVIALDDIRVQGMHNYENIMCAILVAAQYGLDREVIREVLGNFGGVEHRMEYVRKLHGRTFYNDSKATNNKSTEIALDAFTAPTIVLLGGLDRGQSFDELEPHMEHVKHVICYGETKDKIKAFCDRIKKDCIVLDDLEESVKAAYNLSDEGDVILLSPACASWDQFETFEERGELFKKIVEELN